MLFVLHCFCCGCRGWDGDKLDVGVVLPLADDDDPWLLEKGGPSIDDDDFLLPSLSSSSLSSSDPPRGGDRFEAAVAVAVTAGVIAERVGVVDEVEVEDDGEFVEIAAAAAEN
jgi:hypothetical protein